MWSVDAYVVAVTACVGAEIAFVVRILVGCKVETLLQINMEYSIT